MLQELTVAQVKNGKQKVKKIRITAKQNELFVPHTNIGHLRAIFASNICEQLLHTFYVDKHVVFFQTFTFDLFNWFVL